MGEFSFPHDGVKPIQTFCNQYEIRTQGEVASGSFFIGLISNGAVLFQQELRLLEKDLDTRKYLSCYIKSILWIYGCDKIFIDGDTWTVDLFHSIFSDAGELGYEYKFFTELASPNFVVLRGRPAANSYSHTLIRTSDSGLRVGLDLGASSIKAVLVNSGELLKSEILEWSPSDATHGDYILEKVMTAIDSVCPGRGFESIGISTAGIISNNEIISSSLYRSLNEKISLIALLRSIYSVPITAINDGDAAALAVGKSGVLAFALGSDLGGGYVTTEGMITGHLNELAFVPFDLSEQAPECCWSHHHGTGGVYLSIRGRDFFDANNCDWETYAKSMGHLIAQSIPWFKRFYSFHTLALLGGIASEKWGEMMAQTANEEICRLFPELANEVQVIKPSSSNERFQQAIAVSKLLMEID